MPDLHGFLVRGTLVLALLVATAAAQSTWLPMQTFHYGLAPMAYDQARGRCVQLVGDAYANHLCETREWDGNVWIVRRPATSPPNRVFHALAYDAARARVVMFGGANYPQKWYADTWEWDGVSPTWVARATSRQPSARYGHAMAFDSARGPHGAVWRQGWKHRALQQ